MSADQGKSYRWVLATIIIFYVVTVAVIYELLFGASEFDPKLPLGGVPPIIALIILIPFDVVLTYLYFQTRHKKKTE